MFALSLGLGGGHTPHTHPPHPHPSGWGEGVVLRNLVPTLGEAVLAYPHLWNSRPFAPVLWQLYRHLCEAVVKATPRWLGPLSASLSLPTPKGVSQCSMPSGLSCFCSPLLSQAPKGL